MNIRDTFCVRGDGLRGKKKKMKVTLSAAREYGEKCDTSRRRVTPLAVDTQRASERASEYADENESVHIKRTEQFQRVEERERKYPSTVLAR